MKNILVLGAGRVGSLIIDMLQKEHRVTVIDPKISALDNYPHLNTFWGDLNDYITDFPDKLSTFDLVIGAVPGAYGLETAKTVLNHGKDYVDISFAPEDLRELNDLAKNNNVRCLIDFGVAPGLSNLVFGYFYANLKKLESFTIKVGGLPQQPNPPWWYEAPFSPKDVIEEYIRPARYTENGKVITAKPLTDLEYLNRNDCPEKYVKDLVAFLTDGVRTLLDFTDVNIKEKTIRYLDHYNIILALQSSGFFDKENLDLTSKLLVPAWQQTTYNDFTLMDLEFVGILDSNVKFKSRFRLYDLNDNYSSMARTTGFTCLAGANLLLNNIWTEPGVYAPEIIGQNLTCYNFVIDYLERQGIKFTIQN